MSLAQLWMTIEPSRSCGVTSSVAISGSGASDAGEVEVEGMKQRRAGRKWSTICTPVATRRESVHRRDRG
jgi:hypothetical protein